MARLPRQKKLEIEEIALEIAPFWQRSLAFVMDALLIFGGATLLLHKFILPGNFPGALDAMHQQVMRLMLLIEQGDSLAGFTIDGKLQEAAIFVQAFLYGSFWLYFSLSELWLNGSSLGKRVFRLQVISTTTFQRQLIIEIFLRSGIKGMTLFAYFPLMAVDYIVPLFNSKRLSLHDMLCRTMVIVEPFNAHLAENKLEEEEEAYEDTF